MNFDRPNQARRRAWQKVIFISLGTLTLLILLLHVQPAQADEPDLRPEAPGSISGFVTNDEGVPLAGIDVQVYVGQLGGWQLVRTLSTDANGAYRAAVLATGNYHIGFRDPQGRYALEFNDSAITVDSAADIPIAGNDVQGVNARLSLGGTISGSLAFTGVLRGFFSPPTVTVQALGQINGKWQEVATAAARSPSGIYSLTLLPIGVYRVCASVFYTLSPQGQFQECYDNIASGVDNAQDVPVIATQTTTNINLLFGDQADLASLGGVVSAADGKPLSGIEVTVYRADLLPIATVETNQAGAYQIAWLLPGEYVVGFTDLTGPYLAQYYKNAHVAETALPIALKANDKKMDINVNLEAGAQILGTVLLVSQTVASNATVQILDQGNSLAQVRSITADPRTGVYRSGGLFPGVYKVLASVLIDGSRTLNGYYGGRDLAQAKDVVVGTAETKPNIDVVVGEGAFEGGISGLVTDGDGKPLAGIRVGLLRSDPKTIIDRGTPIYRSTATDGRYAIGGLVDGPYWLLLSDPTGIYATTYHEGRGLLENPAPLAVVGGQTTANVNVVLVRGGAISGRVYQRNGTGVVDAQVALWSSLSGQALPVSAQSSGNGSYKISGIRPGLYRLCALHVQFVGRCYGGGTSSTAPAVAVVAAGEVKNIDIVIGAEAPKLVYLPFIDR